MGLHDYKNHIEACLRYPMRYMYKESMTMNILNFPYKLHTTQVPMSFSIVFHLILHDRGNIPSLYPTP